MKRLKMMVGPPGAGKSTYALSTTSSDGLAYINQDSQGKHEHLNLFHNFLSRDLDIVIDRLNFTKEQRQRYIAPAKAKGYTIEIIVLHENQDTCMKRMLARENHETITDEAGARQALHMFQTKYERVTDDEADTVTRVWPEGEKTKIIVCDIDGTMANIEHRLHYVRREGKKDWKNFFKEMDKDVVNEWCQEIVRNSKFPVVFCSGRPDDYKQVTKEWLTNVAKLDGGLMMRSRNDFRRDDIVKEQILDFEILTRYSVAYVLDDRKQVVDMWRKRGLVCLQCNEGDF